MRSGKSSKRRPCENSIEAQIGGVQPIYSATSNLQNTWNKHIEDSCEFQANICPQSY